VNILSTVCHYDNERMSVYTATKKALQGLTDVLRKEAREHGVRVISIYPGGTDTEFRAEAWPRYMRPASVAEAVVRALTMPDDLVVHHLTFRPMVEANF
jgi:short-subunit dehydrogenase